MKSACDACQRAKTITLQISGDKVCTYCERFRHECEARGVCKLPTREARREYIAGVASGRGQAAARRLEQTARELWPLRGADSQKLSGG